MDLSTLRRQAEALLSSLARAERDRRSRAGLATDLPSLFAPFPALASTEAVALAREALDRAPEADQPAARAALDLAATACEAARTARLDAERLAFDARAEVLFEGGRLPVRALAGLVAEEPLRERRARLARAGEHALAPLEAPLAHRVEACQELAAALGYPSYEALRGAATGVDLAALAAEAEAALRGTDDAWRDLFDFGLRRAVGRVSPGIRGEAGAHDLARFSRLAPLDDVYKGRRLLSAAQAFVEAMGLSADAGGRIEVDDLEAAGRGRGAWALEIEVPGEIAVVLGRGGGAPDFAALFGALGRAQHAALADPDLPPEHRRGGERGAREAAGLLFAGVLFDDGFLRRFLDADPKEALEAARLVAIARLGEVRRAAAALLYERALYAEGPREEMRGLYRERYGKALALDWPVEPWLADVAPRFEAATRLRGWGLWAALRRALLDAANEDWWRNPRAGAFFKRFAAPGGRDPAEKIAAGLGGALSLERAAKDLVEVAAR